jgi:hypothetical protein
MGNYSLPGAMLAAVGTFDDDEQGNFARFGVVVGHVGPCQRPN